MSNELVFPAGPLSSDVNWLPRKVARSHYPINLLPAKSRLA